MLGRERPRVAPSVGRMEKQSVESRILQLEAADVDTLANVRELIGAMESDNAGARTLAIGIAKRLLPSAPVPRRPA